MVSAELTDGRVEITYRSTPLVVFANLNAPMPKEVCTKYTLETVGSEIKVTNKIEGYIEQEQRIPEKFIFEAS